MEITPLYTAKMKADIKLSLSKEIGVKVSELRKEKGYSQEKLGFLIDSNKQFIYKIENGLFCPTIATLFFIAQALECDILSLLPKN